MADVKVGVGVRKAFPWLEELAKSDIEALQREVSERYRHPAVERVDPAEIGKAYRKAETQLRAALSKREEIRHEMLNHWCQHGITSFPAGLSAPYRVVPRVELTLDSEEIRELVGGAWEEVTVQVREVDPALLLAYAQKQGLEMEKRLARILYGDCTPEMKSPRETPVEQDKRVPGKTPKRKKRKALA